MRIVLWTEFFPADRRRVTGGVEARVLKLVDSLAPRHRVRVVARTGDYDFNSPAAFVKRGVFFFRSLVTVLVRPEPAGVVEGTNFVTYLLAWVHARRVGAKAVAWWPDVFLGEAVKRLGWVSGVAVELAERLALLLPWDGVIALSEVTKRKLVGRGVKAGRLTVVHGGVARPAGLGRMEKYRRPTLVCISRLVGYKRVDDAVLAAYCLAQSQPGWRLLVVGEGPERGRLERLVAGLGLNDQVRFLGRVSERRKWRLLRRAWVHLLPSAVEGFGLVTIEALAAGTPVVNADTAISREVLAGSNGGLLVPVGDYVGVAEAVGRLLSDRKLYTRKVLEGRRVVKRYGWETVNQKTEAFYTGLLAR